jgi:hypothetical protein
MTRYHIIKSSRVYLGAPYTGPSNSGVPAQADNLSDAIALRDQLLSRNPVGWDIYDSVTGKKVYKISEDVKALKGDNDNAET